VIPDADQFLPVSSALSVTFTCNVSEDELNSAGRQAVWEVDGELIDLPVGVRLEQRSEGVVDLIATSAASDQFNESGVMVVCLAQTATSLERGPTFFVRFFGKSCC
jgi:hypothetical protein